MHEVRLMEAAHLRRHSTIDTSCIAVDTPDGWTGFKKELVIPWTMETDTKLVSAITALTLFTALAASQPMPDVDGGDQIEQIESSAQQVEDTSQTRENNETAAQDVNQDRQQSQNQNKGIISGILSFLGL